MTSPFYDYDAAIVTAKDNLVDTLVRAKSESYPLHYASRELAEAINALCAAHASKAVASAGGSRGVFD